MTKNLLGIGTLALISLALITGLASATSLPASQIDFLGGSGGNISFTPAPGNTLDVTGAPITGLTQLPTFLNYAISGGYIDVITGSCIIGCTYNTKTKSSSDGFADGGLVEIFGSVPGLPGDPSGLL